MLSSGAAGGVEVGSHDGGDLVEAGEPEDLLGLLDSSVRSLDGVRSTEVFTYLHLEKQSYAWGAR